MKITSQYEYDYTQQYYPEMSDELITIPDESFTIQELLQRAVSRTMPDIELPGYYDYDDDQETFFEDDLLFNRITDYVDLIAYKELLEYRQELLDTKIELAKKKGADSTLDLTPGNADEEPK